MRANLSRTSCAELSVVGVEYGWFGCWSSAVAVLYSGWLVGGCGAEVVRQRGATARCDSEVWWWWATARCSAGEVWSGAGVGVVGLVVVFRNSRGQVGRKCAEWNIFLVVVSRLGGFCTKNNCSELWFWDICPQTGGVGPSGVGGYMKERAAVGPHSQTAARFGPLSTSNGEGASA